MMLAKRRFDELGRADQFGARSGVGARIQGVLREGVMIAGSGIPKAAEVYIGAPIEYASERMVLKSLLQSVDVSGLNSIIFANVNLGDRQLDFIVATEQLVLLIEAKGFTRPVRGEKNGRWQVQVGIDDWKPIQNAYLQALQGSLRLRDVMRTFGRNDVPYPSAALIFAPSIPKGSTLPKGDFKVSVDDLSLLRDLSIFPAQESWPLAQWRHFAKANGLERMMTVEAAIDRKVTDAESILNEYGSEFRDAYNLPSPGLIPFLCNDGEHETSTQDIVDGGVRHPGVRIVGPSGCGKSLLAQSIAIRAIEQNVVPLFIEAKYFDGELGRSLEREVALLGIQPARNLLSSCRTLEWPLLLIVDGFNECPKSERNRLARCIKAVRRRYEASVIITAQEDLDSLTTLRLPKLVVAEPKLNIKQEIAGVAKGDTVSTAINVLLEAVRSGLESKLIGDVGRSIPTGASRFALFDAYVRLRLGGNASEGIRALALLAGHLTQSVSFSASVRDFDRLMQQNSLAALVFEQLFSASLLDRNSDRVSFAHEMYFNAFAAESVVRVAAGDCSRIATALAKPIHKKRKALVIGAIDDHMMLNDLLGRIDDPDVIASCVNGECGEFAKQWVERHFERVLASMNDEARTLLFQIEPAGWVQTIPQANTLAAWNATDEAFLDALPGLLCRGMYLDEVFAAIGAMDDSLERALEYLLEDAQKKGIAIRTSLFGAAYVFQGMSAAAITRVCASAHSGIGFMNRGTNDDLLRSRLGHWIAEGLSPGQLYFWLRLATQATSYDVMSDVLPMLIEKHWRSAPYHLRLDLLNAAYFCGRASEPQRQKIIEALEALSPVKNVMLSSTWIDALASLGALTESEEAHDRNVEREIALYLANPDDADNWSGAAADYFAQFDHPYSGAYSRVISELPEDDRHQFLVMALRGVDEHTMFLSSLIIEIAEFGNPIDGELIQRWTVVPPRDYFAPQDAASAFVTSHLALGRLGVPLETPTSNGDSIAAAVWTACGQLLYWTNRCDLEWAQRVEECIPAWRVLLGRGVGFALDPIRHFESAYFLEEYSRLPGDEQVRRSIIQSFPDEVASLCRHALRNPEVQQSYFPWPKVQEILSFAISELGEIGQSTDMLMLKQLVDIKYLGEAAVAAIRKLEQASSKTV